MKKNIFLLIIFFLATIGTKIYSQEENYRFSYYVEGEATVSIPSHIDESMLTAQDKAEIAETGEDYYYCGKDDNLWLWDIGSLFKWDEETRRLWLEEFFDFQNIVEQDSIVTGVREDFEERVELKINLNQLIFEQRLYIEDEDNPFFNEDGNNLWGINTLYFTRSNDNIIVPKKGIEIGYDELESGVPYAYTDISLYLYLKIEDESDNSTVAEVGDEELFNDCMGYTSITEVQKQTMDISIYPNPAREQITVNLSSFMNENIHVEIFNTLGAVIFQQNTQSNQIDIDINSLPAGIYMIRCGNEDKMISKRFIKQ